MRLLITPSEAVDMAFGGKIAPEVIQESIIAAAQLRYIKPVLGASLYKSLEEGKHSELVEEYIKPALAHYVKNMALPAAAFRIGELGIVRFGGDCFQAAGTEDIIRLRRIARSEAESAITVALEHVEASLSEYPEYDSRENVKRRISLAGGIAI